MARLFHFAFDPASRHVRLALGEYGRDVELVEERPWERPSQAGELNPSGLLPVLVEGHGAIIREAVPIAEYLDETRRPECASLIGDSAEVRAETRRLVQWISGPLTAQVSDVLLHQKVVRRFADRSGGGGAPDMNQVRAGLARLAIHLDMLAGLADERKWLAGEFLSHADLAAAAHVSVIDYLGDVPWSQFAPLRAWYQRIKSRPAFKPLLADRLRGIPASRTYADLDF